MNIRITALTILMMASLQAKAETAIERGRYLMESIVACANCHTPQGPQGPLAGMDLAGGLRIDDKAFTAYASNITPDKTTGIGTWTEAQIISAIRNGRRPNGTLIGPPMPIGQYRNMSDDDVHAIVAYLHTVKPVKNAVPKSVYKIPLPPNYGPPVVHVGQVLRQDKLEYGHYLAGALGHCIECHTPFDAHGVPDLANRLGAGGNSFYGPWGVSVSRNITPAGLEHYSDAELEKMITAGIRPDGSMLKPPMGVSYYANMTADDKDALIAYLHSMPRK